jgi:hypothetical protein
MVGEIAAAVSAWEFGLETLAAIGDDGLATT